MRAEEVQDVQEVEDVQGVKYVKDVNEVKEVTRAQNLSREVGGQWLSCTTRHVRIYSGYVDPETNVMDQMQLDKLTLMLDPDNEFEWTDEATEKVFDKFRELIDIYAVSILNLVFLANSESCVELRTNFLACRPLLANFEFRDPGFAQNFVACHDCTGMPPR